MHQVEVDIDACPEHVWAVLADVARWPEWSTAVTGAAPLDGGPAVVGGGVWLRVRRQGVRVWRVTALSPYRGFTWSTTAAGCTQTLTARLGPLDSGSDDAPAAGGVPAGPGTPVVAGVRGAAASGRRTHLVLALARTGTGLALLRPGGSRAASAAHVDALVADLRRRCERRGPAVPGGRAPGAAAVAAGPVGGPA